MANRAGTERPAVDPIPFEELEKVVLPLITIAEDARWHPVGTAFVVGTPEPKRALLLTAAHNLVYVQERIDEPWRHHHPAAPREFLPTPAERINLRRTRVYALLVLPSGSILAEMVEGWFHNDLDVALLLVTIRPDQDAAFPAQLALDTRPIATGVPVMAVGYPAMRADFSEPPDYGAEHFRVKLDLNLVYRTGTVTALRPQGEGIHRWPGFLVNFALDSGMSGGPIIDLSGESPVVRGIVGGDLSESPDDGTRGSAAHAFAELLWPAMIIKTPINVAARPDEPPHTTDASLLDLARYGIIDDRGRAHEHVRIDPLGDGRGRIWWDPGPNTSS